MSPNAAAALSAAATGALALAGRYLELQETIVDHAASQDAYLALLAAFVEGCR